MISFCSGGYGGTCFLCITNITTNNITTILFSPDIQSTDSKNVNLIINMVNKQPFFDGSYIGNILDFEESSGNLSPNYEYLHASQIPYLTV